MRIVKWTDDAGDVYEFRYDAERNLEVFVEGLEEWLLVEEDDVAFFIDMVAEMEIRRRLDRAAK